jgi:molecular chaperone GrpE
MRSSPVSEQRHGARTVDRGGEREAVVEREQSQDDASSREGAGDELAELRQHAAQLDDRYKRALADLDNYRKRSAREVERRAQEAREAITRDWLDVVDSVERALRMDSAEQSVPPGLRALLEQMEATLARHGVRRVGEVGERFDPELHEAIDVRATDEFDENTIVGVARSGFALGDRALRPAQVVVARRPSGA